MADAESTVPEHQRMEIEVLQSIFDKDLAGASL
jgi:hypothetical protein